MLLLLLFGGEFDEPMYPRLAHMRGLVRLAPDGPGVPFHGDVILLGRDGASYLIAPPEELGCTVVRRVKFEWNGAIGDGPGRFIASTQAAVAGFEFRPGVAAFPPDATFYVAVSEAGLRPAAIDPPAP